MKTNISTSSINRAHPPGVLWSIAEHCSATCRVGALATLLILASAPRAHAAGGTLVQWDGDTPPTGTFIAVATGGGHRIAIKEDGTLLSWGLDDVGQVSFTPSKGTFKAVAAGENYSVALRTDGTLVSWGDNTWGQVSRTPRKGTFKAVAAGFFHSVALRMDGTLVSWGSDGGGQVSGTPTKGTFKAVAAGGGGIHSVALKEDGTLVSWGDDFYGQVSGTPTGDPFSAVAAGFSHSVAIVAGKGTLVSWGDDLYGAVSGTPTTGTYEAVAAGWHHSVAIKVNQPPVAQCQDVTVFADALCVADVSIDAGSFDPDAGDTITLSQSPASPYLSGQTVLVTLTVTDSHGASSYCLSVVSVVDNTPPVIGTCPANQSVNATSPGGALVTFTAPSATDNCPVTVSCAPAPGSTFPFGLTTVTCTAIDDFLNQSVCTFAVNVKNAVEQITDLFSKVDGLASLRTVVKFDLLAYLKVAQGALGQGDTPTACAAMQDFINLVKAQAGKRLILPRGLEVLVADATRIRAVIGCP